MNAQYEFAFWAFARLQWAVGSLSPSDSAVGVESVTVGFFLWFVGLFRRVRIWQFSVGNGQLPVFSLHGVPKTIE